MSNLVWQIGAVRITRVQETLTAIPLVGFFPAATPEALAPHLPWLQPHFVDADGNALLSIHGLVVESQGRTILVDTCIGENWPETSALRERTLADGPTSPFLANLEAAGFARERIDVVLCTHLHFDHVGCNTMRVGDVDVQWTSIPLQQDDQAGPQGRASRISVDLLRVGPRR